MLLATQNLKIQKFSLLYEKLQKDSQQLGVFLKNLNIDEAVALYHGHHFSKMFIRSRSIGYE